jgi:hypothetical protein
MQLHKPCRKGIDKPGNLRENAMEKEHNEHAKNNEEATNCSTHRFRQDSVYILETDKARILDGHSPFL